MYVCVCMYVCMYVRRMYICRVNLRNFITYLILSLDFKLTKKLGSIMEPYMSNS
jgi:hypothetical protein